MKKTTNLSLEHFMFMVYVVSILSGSYLAISTLRGLFREARELEYLATATALNDPHKVLVFDSIEPSSGQATQRAQ